MRNCLVIKTSSLGDVLQTLPTVLALKKQYPALHIDWVIEKKFAYLLKTFEGIDGVFTGGDADNILNVVEAFNESAVA